MKITKRKWGQMSPVYFYRDVESGKLFMKGNRQQDYTDTLFNRDAKHVFDRSLQSRLFKTHDKAGNKIQRNEITTFIENLCKNADIGEAADKLKGLSDAEVKCNETLSGYGKSFTAPGSETTLHKALLTLIKGNDEQKTKAKAELEKIQKALQKEKENRINRVRNSIKENKIPLLINNDGTITANNERADWLLKLLQPLSSGHNGECYPVLAHMEKVFSFQKLSQEIHGQIMQCESEQAIAKVTDEVVNKYLRSLWEEHPECHLHMKYYFQAVREYFKENFPIRTKRVGSRKRQELLTNKDDITRLLEPRHIANTVRRKLINQSTQMHILYGKLYEYCCKSGNRLPVNSETLQWIQVLEAVKKQVMTAILWSISRLRYFYNYLDGDGDILSKKQENYRKGFLIDNNNSDEDVQACKERLQDFFPLEERLDEYCGDDRHMYNELLDECVSCIARLRVNIFHSKNMSFTQTLKRIANENAIENKEILLQLYQRDRKNLEKAFALRISSMNLPLYYRKDFLSHVFTKHGVEFSLYSAIDQMTPSFRRVYERGKNLGLKWFKQLENTNEAAIIDAKDVTDAGSETDTMGEFNIDSNIISDIEAGINTDAQRAVRNFLQLIYKHHFLPGVKINNSTFPPIKWG
jgi:hypothetical protein